MGKRTCDLDHPSSGFGQNELLGIYMLHNAQQETQEKHAQLQKYLHTRCRLLTVGKLHVLEQSMYGACMTLSKTLKC